jgi:hypothetical protein
MTHKHNLAVFTAILATIAASGIVPPQPNTVKLSDRAKNAYIKQLANNKNRKKATK